MFQPPPREKPGLFVTGTDTGVGKTVVCCAIAAAWRERHRRGRLGVCKPFGSGCHLDRRGQLVHEDAQALAAHSGCTLPLEVVNPLRFAAPLAPAVAAETERRAIEWDVLGRSLTQLDREHDALLIEGVGGVMVPLDPRSPRFMVAQLAAALGYPVLVVCRPNLGTLNHTAMTVELLRQAGCRVSGLVINGIDPDPAAARADPSLRSNADWLERLTGVKVLARLPRGRGVAPATGRLDPALVAAAATVNWDEVLRVPGAK